MDMRPKMESVVFGSGYAVVRDDALEAFEETELTETATVASEWKADRSADILTKAEELRTSTSIAMVLVFGRIWRWADGRVDTDGETSTLGTQARGSYSKGGSSGTVKFKKEAMELIWLMVGIEALLKSQRLLRNRLAMVIVGVPHFGI
jgi:hypothetical protein